MSKEIFDIENCLKSHVISKMMDNLSVYKILFLDTRGRINLSLSLSPPAKLPAKWHNVRSMNRGKQANVINLKFQRGEKSVVRSLNSDEFLWLWFLSKRRLVRPFSTGGGRKEEEEQTKHRVIFHRFDSTGTKFDGIFHIPI